MGQITNPSPQALILTALDRLVAANAGGGMSPGAAHVIALGEDAGLNMGSVSGVIVLGEDAGRNLPATANNTIVIGQNSGTAIQPPGVIVMGAGSVNGPLTAAGASADSLFVGNRVATNLTAVNAGSPILPTAPIMIGSDIARSYTSTAIQNFIGIGRNIVPLHSATGATLGQSNSIMIGSNIKAARNTTSGSDGNSIMIGHRILTAQTLGTSEGAVIIGNGVLTGVTSNAHSAQGAVIIGNDITSGASDFTKLTDSVVIGHDIVCTNASNPTSGGDSCVYIGSAGEINGQRFSVQIGHGNTSPGTTATRSQNNVIIGYNNNMRLGVWSNSVLIGDNNTEGGIGTGTMIYGDIFALSRANNSVLTARFSDGNIVLGRGANYAMGPLGGSSNCVYLRDGTGSGTLPTGGGYFYGTTGQLRWVSSAGFGVGTNTILSLAHDGTVATLPAAGLAPGHRAYVTDALAPVFMTPIAGGGAEYCPVFWNGANWIAG